MRKLTTHKVMGTSDWRVLSPKCSTCITPANAQRTWKDKNIVRAKGWRGVLGNAVFWTEHGGLSHEHTVVVAAQGLHTHTLTHTSTISAHTHLRKIYTYTYTCTHTHARARAHTQGGRKGTTWEEGVIKNRREMRENNGSKYYYNTMYIAFKLSKNLFFIFLGLFSFMYVSTLTAGMSLLQNVWPMLWRSLEGIGAVIMNGCDLLCGVEGQS